MAHREGRAGREPALLEKDRQEAHVTNPQQWTKGKPVPERKKRRRFILIKELKREWEGKMRARICARAIKSPTIISITAVSPWGMPVRECPWVTASTWPLKPHSYSYLNLSSVYSGGSRKTDRNILPHSFLEGPGFLLLTLYWSWVGIFRCGPVLCSSVDVSVSKPPTFSWWLSPPASFPVSCPHFACLWFTQQTWGLLSLKGVGGRVLTASPKAQQGHLLDHGDGSVCFVWNKGSRSFFLGNAFSYSVF